MTKELLQQALDALIESRDDVNTCLYQHKPFAGRARYDMRIAFYEQQLVKHDAAIEGLRQALAQQERSYPVAEYEDGQWWVKELESLFVAPIGSGVTADQKRAANIALNFMRTVWAQQEQPASVDAYVGAREDAAIWKKRALEAEELNRKFIAEVNGPTYLGEPVKQEQPAQEPVTVLPDGSAFGVMSFPLPSDHWLYRDREYPTPESTETVDLPPPFVPRTIENLELIRLAAKWAIRAATDCGKENDFDPDAIVQNFVYATLGPYPQKIKDTAPTQPALSDERLAEIAKPFISAMGDHWCHEDGIRDNGAIEEFARAVIEAHCRGGANHG